VFASIFLLLIMLFLAPLAVYLPTAAMAGILFVVAWGLVDTHHIGEIVRASRQEAGVLIATFIATLTLNLEFAIFVGVLLSLMLYLNRTSRPPLEPMAPGQAGWPVPFPAAAPVPESLAVVRLNGSIFFGAVNHLQDALHAIDEEDPRRQHVLLLAGGINFVDLAGAQLLAQEAARRRAMGGGLYLYATKDEVLQMLERTGADRAIGADAFYRLGADAFSAVCARVTSTRT
jgi:sulfate permease, SulP family